MQEPFAALRSEGSSESAYAAIESLASQLQSSAKALASDARKLTGAASSGELALIRKTIQSVERRSTEIAKVARATSSIDVDGIARSVGGESFLNEILAAAAKLGLEGLRISRNAVLSYPYRVTFDSPNAFRLGRRLVRHMRPTAIARLLAEERAKTASVGPTYLESLHAAYLYISKGQFGISVTLAEVYTLLTILPVSRKEYSENDFVRDIGVLQEGGPHTAKDGSRVTFPASTSAKMNQGYVSVNSKGEEVRFASVRFDHAKAAQ